MPKQGEQSDKIWRQNTHDSASSARSSVRSKSPSIITNLRATCKKRLVQLKRARAIPFPDCLCRGCESLQSASPLHTSCLPRRQCALLPLAGSPEVTSSLHLLELGFQSPSYLCQKQDEHSNDTEVCVQLRANDSKITPF